MNIKHPIIATVVLTAGLAVSGCRPEQVVNSTPTPTSSPASIPVASFTPTFTPVPTSGPTPIGGGTGQIAFCLTGTSNGKIYSIDLNGENLQLLAGNAHGNDCHPDWSPNGKQIAFEHWDSDGIGYIYIMDSDGSQPIQLTDSKVVGDARDPEWSPDGTKIAFASKFYGTDPDCSNNMASCNSEIFVINVDGTNLTRLTDNSVDDGAPAWSPNGTKITFHSARDELDPDHCQYADCNYEIYVMNSDGTGITRLSNSPSRDWWPAWSPDGKQIAFTSLRKEPQPESCSWDHCIDEIYIMNVDGSGVKQLTNDQQLDWWPAWSPDGKKITYSAVHFDSSHPDGIWDIVIMDSDGSNPSLLTEDVGAVVSTWQP